MESNFLQPPSSFALDFKLLFESAPGLYLVLTPDFRIVGASNAYLKATMTTREQLMGQLIFDAFPDNPEEIGASGVRNLRDSLETVRKTRNTHVMAIQKYDIPRPAHLGGGFEERHWSPINEPVLDAGGKLIHIIHRVEDVTEFVRAKKAGAGYRETTETLRAQVESMDAEIFARGQELGDANRRLWAMNEELAEVHEQFTALMSQAAAELPPAGGGPEPGVSSPERTIADLRRLLDIHKRMEEELRQAQKLDAVGRVAGGIAHDLNNVLTVVIGYCDLLIGRTAPADPNYGPLEEIRIASQHAAEMTSQLLTFSRRQPLEPVVMEAAPLLREILRIVPRMLDESIKVAYEEDASLFRIKMDPGRLRQVIMNLVVNARDAMADGGILTLELRNAFIDHGVDPHHGVPGGEYLLLAVTDTGVGMSAEVKARVFEPFFTTKDQGRGTGLGLATVYGIVRQSGGYIWLYSEPGVGTCVKVYLPRSTEEVALSSERIAANPAGGNEIVLVVEDNPQIRNLVEDVLQNAGYTVFCASGADEAERIAGTYGGRIDLLLTDVILEGVNGKVTADRLKATRPDLSVLFMSGYTGASLTQREILSGAGTQFLQKPFTPDTLLTAVREALSARTRPYRILVLDDARAVREFVAQVLIADGHEVITAENGFGAARNVAENSIDAVLTDLSMPDREGIETVIELRQAYPHLKIVAMSGFFGPDMLDAAKVFGANATLAKPMRPEILRNTIRDVLVG